MRSRTAARAVLLLVVALGVVACDAARMAIEQPTLLPRLEATATAAPTAGAGLPTGSQAASNELESQVEGVYRHAGPSVVFVSTTVIQYDFFMQPVPQEGSGSGFVYDTQGHIVTNYHVVADADEVSISFSDGRRYPAQVVGQDPATDLAVLKVDADSIPPPLPIADSDRLRVGQFVVAIGNPFGLESTLTLGIISALGRVIESPNGRFIGEAIQTDAAINPGNSGGPMLDLLSQVVGVNSQIISPSGASAGIGFAISANTVRRVVPALISKGRYPHPYLGVNILPITKDVKQVLEQAGIAIPVEKGIIVMSVVRGGPADLGGIVGGSRVVRIGRTEVPLGGDIITALNDTPITSGQDLTLFLDTKTVVGDVITVTLLRAGRQLKLPVTLQERPAD
ncbi:MAG TPA: trypsin-like peptidase domain-containing protein [Anaerolineae bacterium]|nr:trypsin-like peptidase domain-containing protein [Anaerolineae bacterium]HNT05975.1 trypsin-like peptidase domain-containing protein [Anaerolineae bacterium]